MKKEKLRSENSCYRNNEAHNAGEWQSEEQNRTAHLSEAMAPPGPPVIMGFHNIATEAFCSVHMDNVESSYLHPSRAVLSFHANRVSEDPDWQTEHFTINIRLDLGQARDIVLDKLIQRVVVAPRAGDWSARVPG
jgi:hypothetical protein